MPRKKKPSSSSAASSPGPGALPLASSAESPASPAPASSAELELLGRLDAPCSALLAHPSACASAGAVSGDVATVACPATSSSSFARIFSDASVPAQGARASAPLLSDLRSLGGTSGRSSMVLHQPATLCSTPASAVFVELGAQPHPELRSAALASPPSERSLWLRASLRSQLKRRFLPLSPASSIIACTALGRDVVASVSAECSDPHAACATVDESTDTILPLVNGFSSSNQNHQHRHASPALSLKDIEATCRSAAHRLYREVALPLRKRTKRLSLDSLRPPGLLLHGAPGCGKATLARAAAHEANAHLEELDCFKLAVGSERDALHTLQNALQHHPVENALGSRGNADPDAWSKPDLQAQSRSGGRERPTRSDLEDQKFAKVVLLRSIDSLCASESESTETHRSEHQLSSHASALLSAMDFRAHCVAVIATTNCPDSLQAALRRPGRLDSEVEMHVPAISERAALIKSVLAHTQCNVTDATVDECASRARGSVAVDLACAVDAAALESLADYAGSCHCDMSDCRAEKEAGSQGPQLHDEHLQKAMRRMTPSTTGEKVSADSGEVSWDDIGGQGAAKQALKEAMQLTRNAADDRAAVSGNMPHPGGLLLHGPPGCSKTMLARAAASDAGMTMLSVKGPELYSRYVGESEKAVKSLFRRARAAAPAIVLLDELDGLAPPRSAELKGEEASSRVLAQLLTELDSGLAERGVFTLAATNRPDMVDGALLRPGRFSRHIHVQPPVSIEERHEILRTHTRRMRFKSEEERDTAFAWVASEAPSFTGADLARVCSEAGLNAIARSGESADSVAKEDFESALSLVRRERFRSHER